MRAALLFLAACAHTPAPATSAGPVVIELFTSQGCSSCPPADRWLGTLHAGDRVGGRPVLPLAFHVDYWNDLGWADPFSSASWTARQEAYARRIGDRVFTPALIVGGVAITHVAGAADTIAATAPTADLDATLTRDGATLEIRATAPAGAQVWAAVVEDGLETEVHAGENAGEAARDDHVVRALVEVDGRASVTLEPGWRNVRVIAFAQQADGEIVAARALE